MRKFSLSKLRLVFLCFLIIFTTMGCSKMSDEDRISLYKKETSKFLDEHQGYLVSPETRKESEALINKYKLTDEYLRFYFKYLLPNLKLISQSRQRNLFTQLIKPNWRPWLGFAFENFCSKFILEIIW